MRALSCTLSLACLLAGAPAAPAAEAIVIDQASARNYVSVIQSRNPFLTRSRNRTVTTGNTTVTEIVAIGPDPVPLTVRQAGLINRISTYQRGTVPNLDLRQDGLRNSQTGRQIAMP